MNYGGEKFGKNLENVFILDFLRKKYGENEEIL